MTDSISSVNHKINEKQNEKHSKLLEKKTSCKIH